jgi:hypothetical protein
VIGWNWAFLDLVLSFGDFSFVSFAIPYQAKTYRYPKCFLSVHAMEHGAKVKVALAHMGIATPDLDGWNYSF